MSRSKKTFFALLTNMKELFHLKNDKLDTFSFVGSQQQYFGVGILDISYFNEREASNEFVKKDYLIRDYLFKAKCIFQKIEKNYR